MRLLLGLNQLCGPADTVPGWSGTQTPPNRTLFDASEPQAQKRLRWKRETNGTGLDAGYRRTVPADDVVNSDPTVRAIFTYYFRADGHLLAVRRLQPTCTRSSQCRSGSSSMPTCPARRAPSTSRPRCVRATRAPTQRRITMQRHATERGAALILLIGITAALAILHPPRSWRLSISRAPPPGTARTRPRWTTLRPVGLAVTAVKAKAFSRAVGAAW